MGPSVRVAIVRHGESTYNVERRFQGLLDRSVLTERGLSQAVCTGKALQDLSFDLVCSSPLQRASQTTDAIVGELNGVDSTDDDCVALAAAVVDTHGCFCGGDDSSSDSLALQIESWSLSLQL